MNGRPVQGVTWLHPLTVGRGASRLLWGSSQQSPKCDKCINFILAGKSFSLLASVGAYSQ